MVSALSPVGTEGAVVSPVAELIPPSPLGSVPDSSEQAAARTVKKKNGKNC